MTRGMPGVAAVAAVAFERGGKVQGLPSTNKNNTPYSENFSIHGLENSGIWPFAGFIGAEWLPAQY